MKKFKMAKLDMAAYDKLFKLKKSAELEEETNLSLREISRRMVNTRSFTSLEREILEDARMKKFNRRRNVF